MGTPAWVLREQETQDFARLTNKDDSDWKKYHSELLSAVLKANNEEKSRTGRTMIDLPEEETRKHLYDLLANIESIPKTAHEQLIKEYLDDAYRMGPVEKLWSQPTVSDVQIFVPYNDDDPIYTCYTDRGKRHWYEGDSFRDFNSARDWLNRHLSALGLHFTPSKVVLDGTFPKGERINVLSGTCGYSILKNGVVNGVQTKVYKFVRCMIMTFRRNVHRFTVDELTDKATPMHEPPQFGDLPDPDTVFWTRRPVYTRFTGGMACRATMDFAKIMIIMKKTHVLSGSTGIGKTTLANAFTAFIPVIEVLLVLEDSYEMQTQCMRPVIRIFEQDGVFTLKDGLKTALRMFPSRIYLAELRDEIAYIFVDAIKTGHDGSSTTVHASDCAAAIERIIDMAAGHPSKPNRDTLRQVIYERVGFVFHGRMEGEMRYFDEIIELIPGGTKHKVMEFVEKGRDKDGNPIGYFAFYGPTDQFVKEMIRKNIQIPKSWGWDWGQKVA